MKRSADRILVTHVGSLVRPMSIRNILSARDYGRPYDEAAYEKTLREEVAGVVRKQANVGVDIVSDGEYGKAGWIRYVAERLGGFVHREMRPGDHEHNPIYLISEVKKFPEFYAAYSPIQYYDWLPPGAVADAAQGGFRGPAAEPPDLGVRRTDHLQGTGRDRPGHRQFQGGARGRERRGRVHAGRRADERARAVAQRLLQDPMRRSSSRSPMR